MRRVPTPSGRIPDLAESLAPWRREARATAVLAWPLVLTFLSETAIAVVDIIIIGRLGSGAVAAAALGTMSFFLMLLIAIGITLATAPLAAQAMGARNPRRVRRVVRQGLWIAALLSLPASALLMRADLVLIALGQPVQAVRGAQAYLDYQAWALVSAVAFVVLRNFAAVLNRPRLGLWVMVAGIPLNGILDYGLVLGRLGLPRMEIAGAGLASLVTHTLMFLTMLLIAVRVRPLSRYNILGRFWKPDWEVFAQIFRIGLPIAGIMGMEFGLIMGSLLMIGWIGSDALAAHQIALMLASVTFKVPLGISQAATVRVGHAAGRRDPAGVARAGWTAIAMGVAFMAMTSVVMWTWPDLLASIFLDRADAGNAEVMALAVSLIMVAAVFQVGDGVQTVGAGVLRGLSRIEDLQQVAAHPARREVGDRRLHVLQRFQEIADPHRAGIARQGLDGRQTGGDLAAAFDRLGDPRQGRPAGSRRQAGAHQRHVLAAADQQRRQGQGPSRSARSHLRRKPLGRTVGHRRRRIPPQIHRLRRFPFGLADVQRLRFGRLPPIDGRRRVAPLVAPVLPEGLPLADPAASVNALRHRGRHPFGRHQQRRQRRRQRLGAVVQGGSGCDHATGHRIR